MSSRRFAPLLAITALALGACTSMGGRTTTAEPDTMVVVLPGAGAGSAIDAGCWATFYDERNFSGDSLTLVGPVELTTLDKGSARQLKRDIKSVVTGPRATLLLYERQFLSARSVAFAPASREAGLAEKLGFGGRIESMRLTCS
ncbi:MAG: hypothetical protein ABIO71_05755 [Caldimonas sp.]